MKSRILSLVGALLLSLPAAAQALEITFQQEAEVTNEFVTLGDIAHFDEDDAVSRVLREQVVAASPEPGERVLLDSAEIIKLVYRKTTLSRATRWVGSASVNVVRHGRDILPEMLNAEIASFLEENRRSLPEAEIRFVPSSMPLPFKVPEGNLAWEIIPSSPSIIDSTRIAIILRVDGRVRKNISIPGRIEAMAQTVAAAQPLERGMLLTPDNTTLVLSDITQLNNPCLDLRSVLGKRLTRSVRAGNVINTSDVEFPPLVKKGELVKIVFQQSRMVLTATGIAHMNGKLDEIIQVRNASSNKVIYCRVTAPGIVEVMI